MNKTKVFLLDDHKIVRDGLKSLLTLDPNIEVVGEEGDPEQFFTRLPSLEIDILILDVSLPGISGLDVLKKVKLLTPKVRVLMLSMHDSPEYVLKSIREGANGYLTKDIQAEELIKALHEVKTKGNYYPGQYKRHSDIVPAPDESRQDVLTPKEKEVLHMMAKGMSSKQIAADFGLSNRTIEAHRLNIMKKLGTNNSAETIATAAKLKLI